MKIDQSVSAIVSGGASGLGAAVAKRLAARGVRIAIFDLHTDAAQRLASEIGGTAHLVDVADANSVKDGLAAARNAHGQERVCINCAGIAPSQRTVSRKGPHDPALFAKVVAVNLVGTFNIAAQSAGGMVTLEPLGDDGERGVIINTASIAAFDGQIGQIAYAASKAGIAGMTLPMARDLARAGIRVMAIAPGIFATPMVQAMPPDIQTALAADVPFPRRLGTPGEFAALVEQIVANPMLNGETIRLDGAIRMQPK